MENLTEVLWLPRKGAPQSWTKQKVWRWPVRMDPGEISSSNEKHASMNLLGYLWGWGTSLNFYMEVTIRSPLKHPPRLPWVECLFSGLLAAFCRDRELYLMSGRALWVPLCFLLHLFPHLGWVCKGKTWSFISGIVAGYVMISLLLCIVMAPEWPVSIFYSFPPPLSMWFTVN